MKEQLEISLEAQIVYYLSGEEADLSLQLQEIKKKS